MEVVHPQHVQQKQQKQQSPPRISRIRQRFVATGLTLTAVVVCGSVDALSARSPPRRAVPSSESVTLQDPSQYALLGSTPGRAKVLPRANAAISWTADVLSAQDEEDDDDGDEWDDELLVFSKLQSSTKSDVNHQALQQQIDVANEKHEPNLFLETLVKDATLMEKVAMSSIPAQLPKAAVTALKSGDSKQKKKSSIRELDFARGRVTPEQELALAELIQEGVKLHQIKTDLQAKLGRDISRAEWTEAANLSPKELRQVVSGYRRAKQLLVEANMGLVHTVVKSQFAKSRMGITYEEMVQEGSLGLLRAAELFDPSRGLRFSTYATIWIKGILSNSHVVEPITLPQREKTKWNKIRKAHDELTKLHDCEPTPEQLAHHVGISVEDFLKTKLRMTQAQQVLSLDYEYQTTTRSGTQGGALASLHNDKAFMEDADLAEMTQCHADVVAALARNLDAREGRLMRLRYGLVDGQTRTISECAQAMGLSQTRTQQIAAACLKKLRKAADMESLQEYLLTIA